MRILYLTLLYFFLFQPLVVSRYVYVAAFLIFSFVVFVKGGYKYFSLFRNEMILVVPILMYPMLLDVYGGEVVYSDRFLYWFLQAFVFSVCFVVFYGRSKFNLLSDIVTVSFVAALVTLLSFTVKPFEEFITRIQADPVFEIYADFEHRYRAHGFSQHLNFSYGVLMGFVAGVCLFLGRNKIYYYALIPFMLFASFVNARIGVVVFLVFFVFFLLSILGNIKAVLFVFLPSVLFVVFFVYYDFGDSGIFDSWYFSFIKDIFSILSGQQTGAVGVIFGEFIVFPEGVWGVLFGTGESIYLSSFGNSDVGFILQINYAGILFTLYLYAYMAYLYLRVGGKIGYLHWFSVMFATTFALMNTKGFFFAGVPGVRLLFLIYVYFIVGGLVKSKFGGRVYVSG